MKTLKNKWYAFDPSKGSRQALPLQRKYVMVQTGEREGLPPGVAVGYLKYGGGDKQSPFFVVPGIGGNVVYWNDCLPADFAPPLWATK